MNSSSAKPRKPGHAATLADVGRAAGVSAMAASAVLNGARTSARISDETRERILEAARQLNYRPNATARALTSRRMNTLGLATTLKREELNQYFLEVFSGVMEAGAELGQNTTVFALEDWHRQAARIPAFCDGRIDGLILLAPQLDEQEAQRLPDHTPILSIHSNVLIPGVINLEPDDEAGAQAMVTRLLGMGHRRILHLAGPEHSLGARRRVQGYLRAHALAGLAPPPDYVVDGEFTADSGRRRLEQWLDQHRGEELPQAIFAGNDSMAIGCLDVLVARGLQVPQQISLVGFDDTQLARSARLATVRQPLRDLGQRAARLLVASVDAKLGEGPAPDITNVVLPTELVDGATLGAPRSASLLIR
ncbi:LacI family DNA-binding transcriptional regulator [Roseateles depolymerans]|uniref:Transcriptional regulator, LacI family n=1 Tax=Roseateles depolymerans TaxID=76731 RepID=A0A0U2U4H3_9BURK|nr:LacI family DNA-binding transcriptional regulator [Roseateles depolymerans]ALV07073.1 Transcriptional regulator, LacI family [Roseateles depolymerans]REG20056.1 LacI family transcriptional regulator [Roseateles depolymerans]